MNALEVILLVMGIVFFIASFIIPERKSIASGEDRSLGEELIKEIVDSRMKDASSRIDGLVEEMIAFRVGSTERSLEHLSNEKILSINEYSDTVLEQISKNHQEIMFLYDMLSEKHKSIQDSVRETNDVTQNAKDVMLRLNEVVQKTNQSELENLVDISPNIFTPAKSGVIQREKRQGDNVRAVNPAVLGQAVRNRQSRAVSVPIVEKNDTKNNNELILDMHNKGRSNLDIARELGLGVGEVKLIIDLYRKSSKGA